MYKKIRRTENAIAGLLVMLDILTMNTNVLVNLRRLDNWTSRTMLPKISNMVNDLEEMVKETKCLEILRKWGDVECLGHWEEDYDDDEEDEIVNEFFQENGCIICNGRVDTAEMNHKVVNRRIKEIRNLMKAYSEFTEVPTEMLTARNLQ